MRKLMSLFLFASCFLAPTVDAESTINLWSEGVFLQVESEYGPEAAQRLRSIYRLILDNQSRPVREKLAIANSTLNALPWISDKNNWDANDYWATPLETLTKFGGDCEDMAIGKFVVLRLMGVPKKNLYLGYVRIRKTHEAHMVLVWADTQTSEVMVLDNLEQAVKPAKDRKDLEAIYLTNADGHLLLLNDNQGERTIKAELDANKMEKLVKIKQRILENQEKYKQFNDQRPLYLYEEEL